MQLEYLIDVLRNDSNNVSLKITDSETLSEQISYFKKCASTNQQIILRETQDVQTVALEISNFKKLSKMRRESQLMKRKDLNESIANCNRSYDSLELTMKELSPVLVAIKKRQMQLFNDLESIYLVECRNQCYYINNILLPNSNYKGHDREMIANALGYAAHYVKILSEYLKVSLRYRIHLCGSRSVITDQISLNSDIKTNNPNRIFPLFSKGSDKIRFDYAVYLLNKNIEQVI